MKVFTKPPVGETDSSPTVKSLLLASVVYTPLHFNGVEITRLNETRTPDFMTSVTAADACDPPKVEVSAGTAGEVTKKNVTVFKAFGNAIIGQGSKGPEDILLDIVGALNKAEGKCRLETFHVAQTLVFLNALPLVTDTYLGTPLETKQNYEFPYDDEKMKLLDNWLGQGKRRKLVFYVSGRPLKTCRLAPTPSTSKEEDDSARKLMRAACLQLLFSAPEELGLVKSFFHPDELMSLRQDLEKFFECYAQWALKATNFSQPPPDAKLPLLLEQLFYPTQHSDPGRLHKVLCSIVEQTMEREHRLRDKQNLFQDLRYVLAQHVFVQGWKRYPSLLVVDWREETTSPSCCTIC